MRKITLRPAVPGEEARWLFWDHHLPRERFRELTETGRALWICGGEEKAGLLRWGYFWDEIPFLNLIWLHESCRGDGAGRAAMARVASPPLPEREKPLPSTIHGAAALP